MPHSDAPVRRISHTCRCASWQSQLLRGMGPPNTVDMRTLRTRGDYDSKLVLCNNSICTLMAPSAHLSGGDGRFGDKSANFATQGPYFECAVTSMQTMCSCGAQTCLRWEVGSLRLGGGAHELVVTLQKPRRGTMSM
jgi:hypothetical protein